MMATLPGTMPRMVRPAPGQNYPRTGFPLEGKKNDNMCLNLCCDKTHQCSTLSARSTIVTQRAQFVAGDVLGNKKGG